MKILFVSRVAMYPLSTGGGTQQSTHALARAVTRRGVECAVVCALTASSERAPAHERWADLGVQGVDPHPMGLAVRLDYPVFVLDHFRRDVAAFVKEWGPDVVVAQLDGALAALDLVPFVRARFVILRSFEHFSSGGTYEPVRRFVERGGRVMANSRVLQREIAPLIGAPVHLVYPPVDAERYRTERRQPRFITLVNPSKEKGVSVFLAIAERMPEERFLIVEGWPLLSDEAEALRTAVARLPNVDLRPRADDMRTVYADTEVLTVPSQYRETFGRVVLEAQASGIPVVVSNAGGLSDVVGGGGLVIDRYESAESWATALRDLMQDDAKRAVLSRQAAANARRPEYSTAAVTEAFLGACAEAIERAS